MLGDISLYRADILVRMVDLVIEIEVNSGQPVVHRHEKS